jgi:hypothetical protein
MSSRLAVPRLWIAVDHPVVIVENVEALLQLWRSGGEGGEIVVILNTTPDIVGKIGNVRQPEPDVHF